MQQTAARSAVRARVPFISLLQDVALVGLAGFFFWVHARAVVEDGAISSAFLAVDNAMLLTLFLIRRRTAQVSKRPLDWFVAAAGWLPLLARPGGDPSGAWEASWVTVQLVGVALHVWALASLGKSFGVVAANRGVKVGGPYQFMRHPIYISSFVTQAAFTVMNPSPWNFGLLLLTLTGQILRVRAEERLLSEDPAYRTYKSQVRWRLVPGVF